MNKILKTELVALIPLTMDNIPDLHAIYSDELNLRFAQPTPHTDIEQTRTALEKVLGSNWGIQLNDTIIGQIGYVGQARIPRLNYIVNHDYWGKEPIIDACRLMLAYGFDTLNYDRVELWVHEQDDMSSQMAQELGFKVKGRIVGKYAKNSHHHIISIWGMLASDWYENDRDASQVDFYRSQVVLPVRDVLATAEFYRDKLGFHIDFLYGNPPAHGGVSRGSWTSDMIAFQLSPVPPDVEEIPQVSLNIRIVGDIDALYEAYSASGVTILSEPGDKPWGFREFAIEDINGHLLVIGTPK